MSEEPSTETIRNEWTGLKATADSPESLFRGGRVLQRQAQERYESKMFPLLLDRAEATDNLRRQLAEEQEKNEKLKRTGNQLASMFAFFQACAQERGQMVADSSDNISKEYADGNNDAWDTVRSEYSHCSQLLARWNDGTR